MADEKIWSGRFNKSTEKLMEEFSSSISFDKNLFNADIAVNIAWAFALVDVDVYTLKEAELIKVTLEAIQNDYHAGKLDFIHTDEDIHTANERWLTERLGDTGARIHTGRSRNDQVVTDLKIYMREYVKNLSGSIHHLQTVLVNLAENHITTVFPGQTHLRQAQPVSLAHYMLAFFFQLQRDYERFAASSKRFNKMPLGSGAIAGAAFEIDRQKLAQRLGFDAPTENSYDATSDRDFALETLYNCAQTFQHISRLCEDLIIWSSEFCRYIEVDERYATGSSMMPQKKNPDSLELIRGKSARVIGNLVTGLTLMKGIPTAYVRDMQEDKEPLFDSLKQTNDSILLLSGVLDTLKINAEKMESALDPALYATDLADYLVRKGVPFRKAHSIVGSLVTRAEEMQITLKDLDFTEYTKQSGLFNQDLYNLFDPMASLNKRNLPGGTGPVSVKDQIKTAFQILADHQKKIGNLFVA